jgi:peptidoglycan/xylan/chitin deacetylase (PgdA/CDA1 family)
MVPRKGQIALTFDDGPHPVHTPAVLSVLEHYGLKANFFLVGENAERHPHLVQQMVAQGHVVGSHSFDHADLTTLDLDAAKDNIVKGQKVVSELAGRSSPFFRFPYGKSNDALQSFAFDQGLLCFFWDVDSHDWCAPDPAPVVQTVVDGLKGNGGIILLHDSVAVTAQALAKIVEQLAEMAKWVYFDWAQSP